MLKMATSLSFRHLVHPIFLFIILSMQEIRAFSEVIPWPPETPSEYSVRLVNGKSSKEGRVEIFYNGTWGTVCDDEWDASDAKVVCIQLGLPSSNALASGDSKYGQGRGHILLDSVHCRGYETRLADCDSYGWYNNDCSHYEDAGVVCTDTPPKQTGVLCFVGISMFIIIFAGIAAICYVCKAQKPRPQPLSSPIVISPDC